MTEGTVLFRFSETVNVSTVDPSKAVVQSFMFAASASFTLDGSSVVQTAPTDIQLTFPTILLHNIYLNVDLCVSQPTCWIQVTEDFVLDMFDVGIESLSNALYSETFVRDRAGPVLGAASIDMNTRLLTLSFSEPVKSSSLIMPLIHVNTSAEVVSLSSSSVVTSANGVIQVIQVSNGDIDRLKSASGFPLMTAVVMDDSAAVDMNGNSHISSTVSLVVSQHDDQRPQLTSWDFNAGDGTSILTISEPIDTGALNCSALFFHSSASNSVVYSPSNCTIASLDGVYQLQMSLSKEDRKQMLLTHAICRDRLSCFVSVSDALLRDTTGNAIQVANSVQVRTFQADQTRAALIQFEVDMDQGLISLEFDDIVIAGSLDFTAFAFSNPTKTDVVAMTNTPVSVSDSDYTSVIQMDEQDRHRILLNDRLCKSLSTTNLIVQASAFTDLYGRNLVATTTPIAASGFSDDSTPPVIENVKLNMTLAVLEVDFDEPIRASAVNLSLFSVGNGSSCCLVSLETSQVVSGNGRTLTISLGKTAADQIKLDVHLATTPSNTALAIGMHGS
jgi:hypothetical protein